MSLADLVKLTIKARDKAKRTPATMLQSYIEQYVQSGKFDKFIESHPELIAHYLNPKGNENRPGIWRASAAGKCLQAQCFGIVAKRLSALMDHEATDPAYEDLPVEVVESPVKRKPMQNMALYNGTFAHIRWHMLFDADARRRYCSHGRV